ncbi:hypothetical protein [Methylobacterium brachiatum]|uniref:MFS transporter n=1 Tax=Methylobacterium brachiatum TaxID=269660 RepID=A0ABV1RBE2_9HYPH
MAPDDVAIAPGSAARSRKAPSPVQELLEPGRGRLMVAMALSAVSATLMTATLIGVAQIAAPSLDALRWTTSLSILRAPNGTV